jgi:hypothetical protein
MGYLTNRSPHIKGLIYVHCPAYHSLRVGNMEYRWRRTRLLHFVSPTQPPSTPSLNPKIEELPYYISKGASKFPFNHASIRCSDFDSFYTLRLKHRMDCCFSHPVTDVAGRIILVYDQYSEDCNYTQIYPPALSTSSSVTSSSEDTVLHEHDDRNASLAYPRTPPTSEQVFATVHTEFGHCANESYRCVSQHNPDNPVAEPKIEELLYYILITTYISNLMLIVFGHLRDFFGKRFAEHFFLLISCLTMYIPHRVHSLT